MSQSCRDLIIIGAGAAGHFAAAEVLRMKPHASVLMLEKTGKVLSKVRISGGGRCNTTHHCMSNEKLLGNYPRGNPWLKEVFDRFSVKDTIRWFTTRGVNLVAESDGRMFPESNSSESIVRALQAAATGNQFSLRLNSSVEEIEPLADGYRLRLRDGQELHSRMLLLASGGSPSLSGMNYLTGLGLKLIPPVPSLFTFNVKNHPWSSLMGLSVENAAVSLPGQQLSFSGPVLVTHWGFSGPAVLKASAAAARSLEAVSYQFRFELDFLPGLSPAGVENQLKQLAESNPRQKPLNAQFPGIPRRLWEQLCMDSGLAGYHNWAESGKKAVQAMCRLLKGSSFPASGKTTFKEEFVTAGGVSLDEVNPASCESVRRPGLFFAGEVLDVDGFTGGFNFQAAWSTAAVAARELAARIP